MNEYPQINPGDDLSATSARQWRSLTEQVKALNRTVFGDNNTQQTASGIRSTARTLPPGIRPPDKTVVIVRKPVAGDVGLLVREARYVNLPPKPCTGDGDSANCFYEWYGPTFDAYPPLGTKAIAYDGDENTADVSIPPKLTTKFYRCHRDHDAWILDPPPSGGGGLDIALVISTITTNTISVKRVNFADNTFVLVEPAIAVRCWPGTDNNFWAQFLSPAVNSSAVYVLLTMIDGIEYAFPTWAFNTFLPNPDLPAGDCG